MKTLILVNTLQSVSSFIYSNHIEFFSYNSKNFPDDQFILFTPHRVTIDRARNEAAKIALMSQCDYLMFIDDDVLIPKDTFEKLQKADKDIIAGLVHLRGYPFNVMLFKEVESKDNKLNLTYYNDLPKSDNGDLDELIPVAAVGFSCCLIKCDVIQALEPPYFVTGPLNTEDVYFCLKTKELEPRPTIYAHTGVRCGHLLNPEPIEYETKELHKNFCEGLLKLRPEPIDNPNPRDLEYITRNLAHLSV